MSLLLDSRPAAMRYLERMGYDNKTFACAVLDMAVKGYLQIKEHAGTYSLVLSKQPDSSVLSPEEKAAERQTLRRTQLDLAP